MNKTIKRYTPEQLVHGMPTACPLTPRQRQVLYLLAFSEAAGSTSQCVNAPKGGVAGHNKSADPIGRDGSVATKCIAVPTGAFCAAFLPMRCTMALHLGPKGVRVSPLRLCARQHGLSVPPYVSTYVSLCPACPF